MEVIRSLFLLLVFVAGIYAQNPALIYADSTQQIIRGFGAANILPWRPDMTANDIDVAFGTGDGQLGFSILRLRIPPQQNDFAQNVSTAWSAHSMGVTIIASPWSPPPQLKTNNNIVGGRLQEDAYALYAEHLKSFVDYMADNGVPMYAVSIQNEPDITVTYESCNWNVAEMLKFVKENAASIGTKVFAPESYNFNKTISDELLNDSAAAANIAFIGGHIYGGGLASYPLAASKEKELWMTEHLVLDTNWTANLETGFEMNACMNAGMSAYIWWYIVRFYGPILEDGTVSKRGYVMSQFARFIRPGFFKIKATYISQNNVYVTAYRDSSKIVIVAVNKNASSRNQTFKFLGGAATAVTPYVTSATKNCAQEITIPVMSDSFTVTLDALSITTFVSNDITVGVKQHRSLPVGFRLFQNYPNPFNLTTAIRYILRANSFVSLKVFDVLGREAAVLVEENKPAGSHTVQFNACKLSSGVYFYRLAAERYVETKKLMLLK